MIKRICKTCGKEFAATPSEIAKGGGIYCSRACYAKAQRRLVAKICPICEKEFVAYPGRIYCSRECANKARCRGITRSCPTCGKEFTATPSEIALGRGIYCSLDCRSKAPKRSVTKACAVCGKVFTRKLSAVKEGRGIYCSRDCANSAQRKRETKICPVCGKPFEAKSSEIARGGGIYCSPECFHKEGKTDNRVTKACETCGQTFKVYPSRVLKGLGKYCSRDCAYLAQRKEYNRRYLEQELQARYYAWTEAVIARDGLRCARCGETDVSLLQTHHIQDWKDFPDLRYDPDNGIVLCLDCHASKHPEIENFIKSWRRDSKRRRPPRNCEYCGTSFKSRHKDQRFCSKKCSGLANRAQTKWTEIVCAECGEKFPIRQCKLERGKARFCSPPCRARGVGRERRAENRPLSLERICGTCGKAFKVKASKIESGRGMYCSHDCAYSARRRRVTKICPICALPFETKPSHHTTYCSPECAHEGRKRRTNKICPVCGETFEIKPSEQKKYCSPRCAAEARRRESRRRLHQ